MKLLHPVLVFFYLITRCYCVDDRRFPADFLFGTATSAYQVEGGWNADGKGENLWDYITHTYPEYIADQSNGDIACDSYNRYEEDVASLKYLGANFYRFSLSWTRILPTGFAYKVNQAGIDYYNKLIDALLAEGIEPMITLYHWDMPIDINKMGGSQTQMLIQYMKNYARIAFENFGDRVKYWFTFNEPKNICLKGFGYYTSLLVEEISGISEYWCSYNVLRTHAAIYHMYDEEFRPSQNGSISIVIDSDWFEPDSNNEEDVAAAERKMQFTYGWFANAIFTSEGDFPQVMRERVANRSALEGFRRSRLPAFTESEVEFIKGTADFLCLNTYEHTYVKEATIAIDKRPSWYKDAGVETYQNEALVVGASDWQGVAPAGFRKLLKWLKDTYNDPEIIITENGMSDSGGTNDTSRVAFYKYYLSAILEAIHDDGVRIKGYTAWSLMDNWEWLSGYTKKFGLFAVDFEDENRTRTAKASADYYRSVIANRCLLEDGACTES